MKYDLDGCLPDYPRTRHLPHKANAQRDDLIASEKETKIIFESENVFVEEKIDAASVGITVVEDQPVIRNRNHILNKGFTGKTPAKMQFSSIWGWFYQNQDKFRALFELTGPVSVYGEWMWARHGLEYDQLPDYFIPYDLFSHEKKTYLATDFTHDKLLSVGFATVPLLHEGKIESWEQLEDLAHGVSPFTTLGPREGIYLKVTDGKQIIQRFKMVRQDFIGGEHWSKTHLVSHRLAK